MIYRRSDIPFTADEVHRFLPWLIAVMACLVTLLLCLGVTVNGWIVDRGQDYSRSFTVNIPADTPDLAQATGRVRETVARLPGVENVAVLSEATIRDMLKSWLGDTSLDGLPLPVVLEVEIRRGAAFDYSNLEHSLSTIAPGVEIDAHERWAAAFSDFSAAMQGLMFLLACLILAAMGVMITFTSRAALKLHTGTVHLLHAIGAEDAYIARQFQQEAFRLVLPGAFGGAASAGLLYWGVGLYMASLPVSVMPQLAIRPAHLALMLIMPPLCAGAAWLVTRRAVLYQLRRAL